MTYNNLSKTKAKELRALTTKKERDRQGLFIVEGEKCVLDLMDYFSPIFLIGTKNWFESHQEISNRYASEILVTDSIGLKMISSLQSLPDIIAIMKKHREDDKIPVLDSKGLYLLLDEIQDPGNLGTIIRTCDWFGIYDIFASKNTVDVYGPKVVQATMGSLSRVRVHYVDLISLIETNKAIKVIGTLLDGCTLDTCDNLDSGFLLMGNEGRGISDELKAKIEIPVTIPPVNPKTHPDSLNVAIATAIILAKISSYRK